MADIHPDTINSLLNAVHGAPFDLLGAHPFGDQQTSIRAFYPRAKSLAVVRDDQRFPMNRLREEGFFELTLAGRDFAYHYVAETHEGKEVTFADPYNYAPIFTEYDLYLFSQGRHLYIFDKMGAHLRKEGAVEGVNFAVWAPNAYRISVVGDFNQWDARVHPMRLHGESGVWELFIPGVQVGDCYKFDIRSRVNDYRVEKTDPYGFFSEKRPRTASVVANLESYHWHDQAWMEQRASVNPLNQPMSIYEVHMGSWKRSEDNEWLTYRELAHELVAYAKDMNYTHLELMPIAEHPFDGSWGYQVTGYFAPTSRYGDSPTDFMYFVDYCHQHGIGVILDWVPAHFPKDGHALSYFDGTHVYEHADFRQGEHPDWGTYIFNYGRSEVRNFLISNALFWAKKYHIDGLRVDAVSSMLYLDFSRKENQWIPNKYGGRENLEAITLMQEVNTIIHSECPGSMTIAEESTAWPMVSRPTYLGGLGFTFKWNMGWMHDTLKYMSRNPVFRRYSHNEITFSIMYAFSENFVLSLSHDEVVHGKGSLLNKMSGDWWQKFASLRLLYGYQYSSPGKKLNFMGAEIGQWREWSETRGLDWHLLQWTTHSSLQQWVKDMNKLYLEQPALYQQDYHPNGFQWIEANDAEQSIFTYMRFAEDTDDFLVVACNFTPVPRYEYRIGVPKAGFYKELINSDAHPYGGGNIGNMGGIQTDSVAWHAFHHSLSLTIPPLGIVILKWQAN